MRVDISPWSALILAVFIWLCGTMLLLAVLFAALCHELGHYFMLRRLGVAVKTLYITPFGAAMELGDRCRLSYGGELLAAAAGPAVNLLLSAVMAWLGQWWEAFYLFAGAQLVLGVFNLLPVLPLDGSALLWNTVAWCGEPYTADRIAHIVSFLFSFLIIVAALVLWLVTGTPFLLVGAFGLFWHNVVKKDL